MSSYFPLFVDVSRIKVMFVGGGRIAQRRIKVLSQFGPRMIVIAPEVTEEIRSMAQAGKVQWLSRPFQETDLDDEGIGMVIAATDDRQVNHQVGQIAQSRRLPVSVADCKEESTFYFPGIAKKENLVVGITASGVDHVKAAQLTRSVQKILEEE